MTLWEFIKTKMQAHAGQTIGESNAEMTYDDAAVFAEIFAQGMKGRRCCAILCQSEMAAALALLSCFAAGVTAVPLSMRYGKAHCNKILDTICPDSIITDEGGELKLLRFEDGQYLPPPEHPALIMCTSGTTGRPKGAMLSEKNIITNVSDIASYFALDETDTILICRPLYHCAVLTGEFLTALVKGARIHFYSESFNPAGMLALIAFRQATAFCGTPTLLSMMARFKRDTDQATLRHICISGECMGREVALRIADAFPESKIYHIYGLTEACPRVSYLPPELFRQYPDCVGIPLPSVSLKILDHQGEPCAEEEEGILWVKGDNIMLGYYRDPEKTNAVLKDGWLCTGDIATVNEIGLLKIKGRNDDLIIRSGMNIYPAEIEAVLKTDPRVREVLIYDYNDRFGTQIGMRMAGDFKTVAEVKQLCIDLLPSFQIPSKIELVAELKRNGSGKIIRKV